MSDDANIDLRFIKKDLKERGLPLFISFPLLFRFLYRIRIIKRPPLFYSVSWDYIIFVLSMQLLPIFLFLIHYALVQYQRLEVSLSLLETFLIIIYIFEPIILIVGVLNVIWNKLIKKYLRLPDWNEYVKSLKGNSRTAADNLPVEGPSL